ncbi:MAG: hypothetical protein K9L82_07775 [Chromatiaceae bacterium]|nr:hypothetical protein [Chromatiaceae bacterium]MCF7993964.1 hypothetical protein [Chromatiaceae bacterium]MCF8015660.1 hypothetical protein [Chromatiaceae bacterium]
MRAHQREDCLLDLGQIPGLDVLDGLDQEAEQPCGLERAVALARGNQARLKVVSVIESLPAGTPLGVALLGRQG